MRMRATLGLCLMLVLLVALGQGASGGQAGSGSLTVSVIDVGQGDSIWIEFPNGKHMLVDAGEAKAGGTIVQFLKEHHTSRLDLLVLTHPDDDHIGGMPAVLDAVAVSNVWDSGAAATKPVRKPFTTKLKDLGLQPVMPALGSVSHMGGVAIEVLGPPTPFRSKTNNNSIVLRLTYGQESFLLPGDMEGAERKAIMQGKPWPHDTVLKAAHHGSWNGTDCAFAQQVSPQYAVMSYAYGNPHNHPHQEAINALTKTHATLYGTAPHGTVTFTTDGSSLRAPATERTGPVVSPGGRKLHCAKKKCPLATTAATPQNATYFGNPKTKVFHLASCRYAQGHSNLIGFQSRAEAVEQGYKPCKTCRP